MVKIKNLGYNLNHQYRLYAQQDAEIAVGDKQYTKTFEILLYPKSLPLAEDMDRVPVIRAIHIVPVFAPNLLQLLGATGNYGLEGVCNVWNGVEESPAIPRETMDLIAKNFFFINWDDASPQAFVLSKIEDTHWSFSGGIVGSNKISIVLDIFLGVVAAGSALPANVINWDVFVEVDWAKVSHSEFQEYIMEVAFTQD